MHIHAHLIIRGFIKKYKYTCWNKHGEVGVNDGELDEDLPDKQQDQDDMHTCQDLSDDDIVDIGGNCADTISSLKEERQCCVYSLFTKETNYIYIVALCLFIVVFHVNVQLTVCN